MVFGAVFWRLPLTAAKNFVARPPERCLKRLAAAARLSSSDETLASTAGQLLSGCSPRVCVANRLLRRSPPCTCEVHSLLLAAPSSQLATARSIPTSIYDFVCVCTLQLLHLPLIQFKPVSFIAHINFAFYRNSYVWHAWISHFCKNAKQTLHELY